jgi:hypothetical protein
MHVTHLEGDRMGVRFIRKARIADGKRDEALAFAAEISDHYTETYGPRVTWGLEVGGDVGTHYWFSDHESLASLEAILQAAMLNTQTNKLLDQAVGLFGAPAQDKLVYTM